MKRPIVWEQTPQGWRRARGDAPRPRSGRSERVPRPPLYRMHAAGVEDSGRSALAAELERAAVSKVAEVAADAATRAIDAAVAHVGAVPLALAVGVLLRRRRK